jgi:hypothetical protein
MRVAWPTARDGWGPALTPDIIAVTEDPLEDPYALQTVNAV